MPAENAQLRPTSSVKTISLEAGFPKADTEHRVKKKKKTGLFNNAASIFIVLEVAVIQVNELSVHDYISLFVAGIPTHRVLSPVSLIAPRFCANGI